LLHRDKIGTEKTQGLVARGGHSTKHTRIGLCEVAWTPVAELMSQDVISANEDTPLSELANILEKRRIKRVPILRDGKLVGIVSRSNLIQALASAPPNTERPFNGSGIRSAILAD